MNTLKNLKKRKGFSLIELIVVILIIAVLALAVFAGGSAAIKKSQISRTTSDLHNFSIAIESAMNETPSVANISAKGDMTNSIIKAVNDNLSADYHLSLLDPSVNTSNLKVTQSDDGGTYVIYKSDKTDAWGNNYYVVFDCTERHDAGISEFYITVVSAGPNAQTTIAASGATGIESDDLFLLVQYTDGDVAATIYNCAADKLMTGGTEGTPNNTDAQRELGKTTKGVTEAGKPQGLYIGTVKNGDGRATLCPVNFQPAA